MYSKVLILISFFSFLGSPSAYKIPFQKSASLEQKVISDYAIMAEATYNDSLLGAEKLTTALSNLSTNQEQQSLKAAIGKAKDTWAKEARIPYGQSEIFRFMNGPIDFEAINDGHTSYLESINFESAEGMMNAWPLDEAYIDYVQGAPDSGLINDLSINLTQEVILTLNERDGEKNISTGYHAIEFLLWGQDFDDQGPGIRPLKDFMIKHSPQSARRIQYLNLLGDTLLDHLMKVTEQWAPHETNYRKELLSRPSHDVLSGIFTSLISMAGDELKSERIENALLLGDQEEEQSCFSDTTVNDIYANALGVKNLYYGTYSATNTNLVINGIGVDKLVLMVNPELDRDIKESFQKLFQNITSFYSLDSNGEPLIGDILVPFDYAIVNEQSMVQAIVDELVVLDHMLRQAAKELGLTIAI